MIPLRTATRGLAWTALLLGVLALVAAATFPRWGTDLLVREVTDQARVAGVDLSLGAASMRLNGDVVLRDVAIDRGAVHVQCDAVELRVAQLRPPRLADVHVSGCLVTQATTDALATGDDAGDDAGAALVPDLAPVADSLRALVAQTGEITVDRITIRGVAGIDASVEHAAVAQSGDSLRLVAQVDVAAPAELRGRVRVEIHGDVVDVGAISEVSYGDRVAGFEGATIAAHRVDVRGLALSAGQFHVAVPLLSISGTRDVPRVEASGGVVTIDSADAGNAEPAPDEHPAALAELAVPADLGDAPAENGDGEDAAQAGPTLGQRFGQWLVDGQTELTARVTALRARPVPSFEIDAGTFVVRGLAPFDISLGAVHYDPSGAVSFTAGVGDVALEASTTLPTLESINFRAEHLDLAPLSMALGPRTTIAGAFDAEGTLRLADQTTFEGTWSLRDGLVLHDAISPLPLEALDASGAVDARLSIIDGRADLLIDASATVADIELAFGVAMRPEDDTWAVEASASVSELTECQRVWEAVPAGLLPDLGHGAVTFEGSAAPSIGFTYRIADPDSFHLEADGFPGTCAIASVDDPWDPARLLLDSYAHHVVEGVTRDDVWVGPGGTEGWVAITEVPAYVPALMYLSEEIMFPTSPGISLGLITRGVRLNLERNRYAYGGSTVSQQLVKNLFFSRTKTLARKLQEVVITWAMESVVPKERILELYMNCVEFGPDVYGIVAAAHYYFGVEPGSLTPLDAAFLANLKPSPLQGRVYLERGHSPDHGWWPERTRDLLLRLVEYGGFIDESEVEWYAPWITVFPTSPNAGTVPWERIERPPKPAGDLTLLEPPPPIARSRRRQPRAIPVPEPE